MSTTFVEPPPSPKMVEDALVVDAGSDAIAVMSVPTTPSPIATAEGADLVTLAADAGTATLADLQAGAAALLVHIVPSLLEPERQEMARTILNALATVLQTTREQPDSQGARDMLAGWVQHAVEFFGTPALDALRAGPATPAPSGTTGTTTATTSAATTASVTAQQLTPAEIAVAYLKQPLSGNGGDNWTARVPANIQAQINANGGVFTGYATLLTQVPGDLDDDTSSGSAPWWTGAHVAAKSEQMVDYRDENGNLVYSDPTLDPMTGLPKGILEQNNVFFQPTVGYSQDSGYSLGTIGQVGIVDTSLAGWEQAPTLCLDEVKDVLTQGLKEMGIPDELIPIALERCYKYDPAFGVLIPAGIGQAAMQLYQSRHGDWYDAVFEAIPAIIVAVVAPELVGAIAPELVGATAGALNVSTATAQGILGAGLSGGINAAANGDEFATGFLTGVVAAYGGSLAGDFSSVLGQAGSQATSAMASSAIRQVMSNGKVDVAQLFAAGIGAGMNVQLSQIPGLPQWAVAGFSAAAASLALTGGDRAAAAAAFLVAAGQSVATSGTSTSSGTQTSSAGTGTTSAINAATITPEQVAGYTLEMQLVYPNGEIDDFSGALVQTPNGVAISTVFHGAGDALTEDSNVRIEVKINGEWVPLPVSGTVLAATVNSAGQLTEDSPSKQSTNESAVIFPPATFVAQYFANVPIPSVTEQKPALGDRVFISGYPGADLSTDGSRPLLMTNGTIVGFDPDRGYLVAIDIDPDHPRTQPGVSGGADTWVDPRTGNVFVLGNHIGTDPASTATRQLVWVAPVHVDAGTLVVGNPGTPWTPPASGQNGGSEQGG